MRKIWKRENYWWLLIISAGFVSASLWAQDANRPEPLRTRVYSLHYITPVQAQAYLDRLKLGATVSQVPQSNALIVTALPVDLVKISSLIDMVDSKQNFVIDRLGPAGMPVPSAKLIMQRMQDISLGTFMDPPFHTKKLPVILDTLGDSTILISPEGISDNVISTINQLKSGTIESNVPAPPLIVPKEITPQKVAGPNEANQVSVAPVNVPPPSGAIQPEEESLNKEINQLLEQPNRPPAVPPVIATPNEPVKPAPIPETAAPEEEPQPEQEVTIESKPVPEEMPEQPPVPSEQTAKAEERPESIEPTFAEIKSGMEPMSIPHGNEELQLQLPETVDIVALLDLVGKYLNINYMYDPTRINGTVTLKLHGPITVSELYTITESVLKFKGFAMSRRDNLVTIVPAVDALSIDPTLKTNGEPVKPGDVVVTTVYNLKYINAQSAMGLLTNMKMGTSISPVVETNTLIVTDYAYRIERIDKLLAMVDQPGTPKEFKFRQLKYTMANTLVPKIQAIAQQVGTEALNVQTGAPTPPTRTYGRSPRPVPQAQPGQQQQPGVYLDYDERTNRVLMVGQEKELELINELIDAFDVPQQELRTIKEYEIQYVDAKEVTDTLSTLGIISGAGMSTTPGARGTRVPSPVPQAQPGQAAGAANIEEPQIAVLESTNSLLVNATPEQHAAILMVISYVDRQPAEV
jgi:type II secretory pathway component GspD/PulD (secretin)